MVDYRQMDRELLDQQREAESDMVSLLRVNDGVALGARELLSGLPQYEQFIVRRAMWSLAEQDIIQRTPDGFILL